MVPDTLAALLIQAIRSDPSLADAVVTALAEQRHQTADEIKLELTKVAGVLHENRS